jgi:diguanylate cyclase (GGDEF)-like protein
MRVLVADDSPVCVLLLDGILRMLGHDAVPVRDGHAAWGVLSGPDPPLLAVLDWDMPGLDGPELCRRVRAAGSGPYTYILMVTKWAGKQNLVAGMDAGADDYLTKPFDEQELRVRLRAGERILALQAKLRAAARQDPLTGLDNRGAILDFLGRELAGSAGGGTPVAVVVAVLYNFTRVNDRHGHATGDVVLCEAAARMRAAVRPYDGVGRYGGEEFLLVLPGCDSAAGVAVAERVCTAVAGGPVDTPAGPVPVSVSLGVAATALGEPVPSPESLTRAADVALYRSKASGRNCVAAEAGAVRK